MHAGTDSEHTRRVTASPQPTGPRARCLATQARQALLDLPGKQRLRREVDTWLAAHAS